MRDHLGRLLSDIPRESAPEIPLDELLSRATAARRRATVATGIVLAGLAAIALGLSREEARAPVHLKLQVIDVDAPGSRAAPPTPSTEQPEEFDLP